MSSRAAASSTPPSAAPPPLPTGWKIWWAGARPKTLPAAVMPVMIGTAIADVQGDVRLLHAALALVVAVALQVGVNFANDYSDGIRGTDDTGLRVGPPRLVGWKLAEPGSVKRAAFAAFGVAALFGLVLAARTNWWLIAVGVAAIAAGWGYTGGPKPYGYAGLGELFVFVFFGLVAVAGTTYLQIGSITDLSIAGGVVAGLVACALLVVNNLRDIPGDTTVGKKTLAVRLGDQRTRNLYLVCILGAGVVCMVMRWMVDHYGPLLALPAFLVAREPMGQVQTGASGRDLVNVLVRTGRFQLALGILLSAGLLIVAHS